MEETLSEAPCRSSWLVWAQPAPRIPGILLCLPRPLFCAPLPLRGGPGHCLSQPRLRVPSATGIGHSEPVGHDEMSRDMMVGPGADGPTQAFLLLT